MASREVSRVTAAHPRARGERRGDEVALPRRRRPAARTCRDRSRGEAPSPASAAARSSPPARRARSAEAAPAAARPAPGRPAVPERSTPTWSTRVSTSPTRWVERMAVAPVSARCAARRPSTSSRAQRIEAVGELVEEQQRRPVGERRDDLDAPRLALGKGAEPALHPYVEQRGRDARHTARPSPSGSRHGERGSGPPASSGRCLRPSRARSRAGAHLRPLAALSSPRTWRPPSVRPFDVEQGAQQRALARPRWCRRAGRRRLSGTDRSTPASAVSRPKRLHQPLGAHGDAPAARGLFIISLRSWKFGRRIAKRLDQRVPARCRGGGRR